MRPNFQCDFSNDGGQVGSQSFMFPGDVGGTGEE